MAQVSKEGLREEYQLAFENFALAEAAALRQLTLIQGARQSLAASWKTLDLGELPEYEPEIRVRKVS